MPGFAEQPLQGKVLFSPVFGDQAIETYASTARASAHNLAQTFASIDQAVYQAKHVSDMLNISLQQTKYFNAYIDFQQRKVSLAQKYEKIPDLNTVEESFKKDAEAASKGLDDELTGVYKGKLQLAITKELGSLYKDVIKRKQKFIVDSHNGAIEDAEELFSRKAAESPYGSKSFLIAKSEFISHLDTAVKVGALTPGDAQKKANKFIEKIDTHVAQRQILKDPVATYSLLGDYSNFPGLPLAQRIKLQEHALSHARQLDAERDRAELKAERLQKKNTEQRGMYALALAATGEVTYSELKQMFRNGEIEYNDYIRGQKLLTAEDQDRHKTNMDDYVKTYRGIIQGAVSVDDIVDTPFAAKDKIKLLQFLKVSRLDKTDNAIRKNNHNIISASLSPKGLGVIKTPEQDLAEAYGLKYYDDAVSTGMDPIEARTRVLDIWGPFASQKDPGSNPLPTIGSVDMVEKDFIKILDEAYDQGRVTKKEYVEQVRRWRRYQVRP